MTPGELWTLAGVDIYMLSALLACCLVTGHGLKPRPLFGPRLAATLLAEGLWAYWCSYQWLFAPDPVLEGTAVVIVKYLGTFLLTAAAFRFCMCSTGGPPGIFSSTARSARRRWPGRCFRRGPAGRTT